MNEQLEIAIIDPNALSALGLTSLLQDIMPVAVVRAFNTFSDFVDDTPDLYVHYFVASQVFVEHSIFFLERVRKVIVLTNGTLNSSQWNNVRTINICQPQKMLLHDLMSMYQHANSSRHHSSAPIPITQILSSREIEVLSLVARGFINKEIANKLNISLTTVISHRKNITEKLAIKTVPGLTIFAVTNGIVEVDTI